MDTETIAANLLLGLRQMLEWGNKVYGTFRADVKKYSIVFLATLVAIAVVYKDFSYRVRKEELVSKSILHLAGGNVSLVNKGVGLRERETDNKGSELVRKDNERQSYIAPEAKITITPKDPKEKLSNVVNVKVTGNYGFTLEPGLSMDVAPLGLGLDLKWFYYQKLGTEVGIDKYLVLNKRISPTVSLSYRLDQFKYLKNTEAKLSYSPLGDFPLSLGIRVNF